MLKIEEKWWKIFDDIIITHKIFFLLSYLNINEMIAVFHNILCLEVGIKWPDDLKFVLFSGKIDNNEVLRVMK